MASRLGLEPGKTASNGGRPFFSGVLVDLILAAMKPSPPFPRLQQRFPPHLPNTTTGIGKLGFCALGQCVTPHTVLLHCSFYGGSFGPYRLCGLSKAACDAQHEKKTIVKKGTAFVATYVVSSTLLSL